MPVSPATADRKQILSDLFSVDLRSLAALRISLGFVLLFDLAFRARFLSVLYTNDGVYPMTGRLGMCLHSWAGSTVYEGGLFILAAAAASCLLLGCFTRVALPICWLLTNSLNQRNPYLSDGGDSLLVLTLFWGMFLPLGARWSLDARRRPPPSGPALLNVVTAALLLQPAIMYFSTGMQKTGPEWRDGSAVWFAVQQDWWAHPLAYVLREHRTLCSLLTFGTRGVELLAPILLFWPWGRRRLRLAGLVLLISFQLGLALSLQLWLFPVHSTLALLPFLPAGFWSALQRGAPPNARTWFEERWEASSAPVPSWPQRLALPFILYVGVVSSVSMTGRSLPARLSAIGSPFGLDETWTMYTPSPYREEGRMTFSTVNAVGEEMDPAQSLDSSRWTTVEAMNEDYRAKYYLESLLNEDQLLPAYAAWVRRSGARNHPPIQTVRLRISKWPIGDRDRREERVVEIPSP